MDILDMLCTEGYFMTNRNLVKNIGPMEALVVGYLASVHKYVKQNDMFEEDEYFYVTIDKMKEDLNISKNYQNSILTKLEEVGLLSKKLIGLPAKRYFRINPNILEQLLAENDNEDIELIRRELNLIAQVCLEKDVPNSLEEPLQKFFLSYKKVTRKNEIELIDIRSRVKRLMNFENCTDKDLLEIIKISTEKGWRNFYSNDFSNTLDRKDNKKVKKLVPSNNEEDDEIFRDDDVDLTEELVNEA